MLIVILNLVDVAAKSTVSSSSQNIDGDGNVQIIGDHGQVTLHVNKNDSHRQSQIKAKPVRSELRLPDESILLKRRELLQALEKRFRQNAHGVTTVALVGVVGMGGIGKTTLARMLGRQYGQKYPKNSVWEINAETFTSMSNSFRDLATALAQTPKQEEVLKSINQIQTPDEQEKQRFNFIKGCLKEQDGWLLIFDNVDSYKDIKDYLPQDPMVWGKGHVIITTRNLHLQEAEGIQSDNMISLEELSAEERLTLFARIRFKCEPEQLTVEERTCAMDFLKEIPSFPLDISTAARYMAHYKLSYDEYTEQLKKQSKEFNKSQEDLLKETSRYTKTRYGIITLALKRIIESNKDFTELLLLMSLLDSQNIPTGLLDYHRNPSTTEQFLDELKRHSFIIGESETYDFKTFSLHRSMQEIAFGYLTNLLELRSLQSRLVHIANTLERYMTPLIEIDKLNEIQTFLPHAEQLLRVSLLTMVVPGTMEAIVASMRTSLYDHSPEVKLILEDSLKKLNQNSKCNVNTRAIAYISLGEEYRLLEEDAKAIEHFEKGRNLYTKNKQNSLLIARATTFLGCIYRTKGDYSTAKKLLEGNINAYKDKNSLGFALLLGELGLLYRDLGMYNKAKEYLKESLKITRQKTTISLKIAWALGYLGIVNRDLGYYEEATKQLEETLAIFIKFKGEQDIVVAVVLAFLGNLYKELDNDKKNREIFVKLNQFSWGEKKLENRLSFRAIQPYLASVYSDLRDYTRSQKFLDKSLKSLEDYYGNDHIRTAKAYNRLGDLYLKEGDVNQAEKFLKKANKIYEHSNHINIYIAFESLAEVHLTKAKEYLDQRDLRNYESSVKRSKEYLDKAFNTIKKEFSQDSEHIKRIQLKLKRLSDYISCKTR